MEVYKNILVPLDGSELSESVLPEVERLAGALNSHIIILRVSHVNHLPLFNPLEAEAFREAFAYVVRIKERLRVKELSVECHAECGPNITDIILGYAAENNIDLIMMATHGYTGAKHLLLGSTAEKVVHNTTKPVVLVRPTRDNPPKVSRVRNYAAVTNQ